jgi:nucleoid DNA-binding protein
MNKVELIAKVVANLKDRGLHATQVDASPIVNEVFSVIQERLYQEEEVKIADFGSFKTVKRDARTGRNPSTGEAVEIPAKNAVTFKPAKYLKEYVQD